MALLSLLLVLVQSLIQYPQPAGDGLDEATHQRMREHQELLDCEMARLLQELERDEGWGAVPFGALQQWPVWVLPGVLLLLDQWLGCRRRSCEARSSSKDQSSCKTLGDERITEQEEDTADPEEGGEDGDMTLETDDSGTENDREGSPVAADDGDKDDAIEGNYDVKMNEDSDVNSGTYDVKEDSDVYNGYDLKKEGQRSEREQLGEMLLCLLHHSQEELQRKQQRSLLETLHTGSYLDVEKTSHWFFQMVRCLWLHVPQSYSCHLVFQPCSRSCQFQLSRGKRTLPVEMLFGVCQGDSDIFVVSQPTEAQKGNSSNLASTAWPETFAVAEAKFFQHIARQISCKRLHLKYLQLFTCMLSGTGFSTSTWKTLVMHVLNIIPQVYWHRKEFPLRLWDIMVFLKFCLKWKHLGHFVLGNEKLPAEISLPPAMQKVEPLNLFEYLARDPDAHRKAMEACEQLYFRLWMLLSNIERSSLHKALMEKFTADCCDMDSL
nr:inositol 1,4,5-trisphosphate receptor-interacting protein-like 1 [Taeniopygia guttata]